MIDLLLKLQFLILIFIVIYNCEVVEADRYPSSQLCSKCGFQYKDLTEREWTCPKCGTHNICDEIDAINLRIDVSSFKHKLNDKISELEEVETKQ